MVLVASSCCAAGAGLEYAVIEGGKPVEGKRYAVAIGDGVVAVSEAGDPGRPRVLFRDNAAEVIFVDHAHREYTVMTEKWLLDANENAKEALESMRERMEAQGENATPQARRQMSQAQSMMRFMPLMGGLYGDGSANTAIYSRTFTISEFNGLRCEQYDETIDGERSRIVCLADTESIGLGDDDASLLDRFISTLARMQANGLSEFGFELPIIALHDARVEGVPIAASNPESNGFVLVGKATADHDPGLFEIPGGYLRAEIPLFGF
ncbi:MAG: hypothetical protein DWQ08_04105 [Proteobacteria bacterium]|nr:MAG: hypothetical protein DWQ08_04105 [Pseudomonadota bacterium]